ANHGTSSEAAVPAAETRQGITSGAAVPAAEAPAALHQGISNSAGGTPAPLFQAFDPKQPAAITVRRFRTIGQAALKCGEVAVVTLAAGAGSRWTQGAGVVKALHPFC